MGKPPSPTKRIARLQNQRRSKLMDFWYFSKELVTDPAAEEHCRYTLNTYEAHPDTLIRS